jgi:DNA-binding NtrC family response regulator
MNQAEGDMSNTIALIVDDNSIRQVVNAALSDAGYAVLEMDARGLQMQDSTHGIDAVCLGIDDAARFDLLQQIRAIDAKLPVIVLTHHDEIAERALREGVYDVIARPTGQRVRHAVARAIQHSELVGHVSELQNRLAQYESATVVPMRDLERTAIERALRATRGSVTKAAKLLGIGRATLYRRLASPDMADIRAGRITTQPGTSAPMSSLSQATMAREP